MSRRLKGVLAVAVAWACANPVAGDLVIQYSKKTSNSSLSITFSSGSSWGTGCGGYAYPFPSYGWGGTSAFVVNGGSFVSYDGYLLPGMYWSSPFAAGGAAYADPLGLGYPTRGGARREGYDRAGFDAESLRRKYYGVEGKDSYLPGGDEGTVAARLARTESVREGLRAFHEGRYADAVMLLREAYLRDTRDAGTKIFYGLALLPLGEYEMAEKAIRRGIEGSGTSAEWVVEVPRLYGNPRDYDQHKLLLRHRTDRADPLPAAFLLAYLMAAEGNWAEAARYVELLGQRAGPAGERLRALIAARKPQ